MAIMRWDPYRDLTRMQEEFNRLFEGRTTSPWHQEDLNAGTFPPIDVYQDAETVMLTAELPGIDAKDVDVHIENGVLTLKGERKLDKEDKKENYVRVERWYGSFTRSFSLPTTVDADKAKADFKNGLLRIALPRKEETKPKAIKVKVD